MESVSKFFSYLGFTSQEQNSIRDGNLSQTRTEPGLQVSHSMEAPNLPPARLQYHAGLYRIWAVNRARNSSSRLYVKTRSPALVDYCIPDWRTLISNDRIARPENNPEDEDRLCHLLRRCGGAEVDTTGQQWFTFESACDAALEREQSTRKYVFGWPTPAPEPGAGAGIKEPVWVYKVPPKPYNDDEEMLEWLSKVQAGEIEEGPDLEELGDCRNMAEYCGKLQAWGAKYYEDVKESAEAREAGLI